MEALTVQDREPFSSWDSGPGLRLGGLKSQRMVLSRAMISWMRFKNDSPACCGD